MSARTVAVLTDTVSPGFFFPLWYRYYGEQFGNRRLYVVTYEGMSHQFRDFELGGIFEIPFRYEDVQRARSMSALVNALLTTSDIVLRVDNYEFLVANPEKYDNLAEFVQSVQHPWVTARGMNVIQSADEPPLDLMAPILFDQRRWVQPVGPMHKTCLTTVPTDWGPGFHWCTHPPQFDDLFMFHLKHADYDMQIAFGAWMVEQVRGNPQFENYYSIDPGRVLGHRGVTFGYPAEAGLEALYREAFLTEFLAAVEHTPHFGYYHGRDLYESVRIELPASFSGKL